MAGLDGVRELVLQAEDQLLLSSFNAAEGSAREALQRFLYCASGAEGELLQDRTGVVLLQALSATQRFGGSAQRALHEYWGSLEAAPPTTLLLWLSLGVDDSGVKREAAQQMLRLLESKRPGTEGGWGRRHYLSLLHLYLFEVLVPELRDASEAVRWLEGTQLPLGEEDRQAFREELLALSRAPPRPNSSDAAAAQPSGAAPPAAAAGAAPQPQPGQPPPGAAAGQGSAVWPAGGALAQPAKHCEEIQPDPGDAGPGPAGQAPLGGSQPGWGVAAYQQLTDAARAAWTYATVGRGGRPPWPSPLAAVQAGVLLALLAALFMERRAIGRRLQQARRSAWGAVSDLLRMGLQLTPNPMTAPR